MKLTDKDIAEIAELLDCGFICFYHRPTGEIESHPDPNDIYFDPEPWEDIMAKIENDWENYDRFEKMNSNEGFQVMENFAYAINDLNFRYKILERLTRRKPFQNFKILIDSSNHRQNWFEFKKNAYIDFVKQQIETK
ncbi:MAG: UPF0158 family protein [Flavobacteriales bacterium]|nr:UPF0158 family protein [Flavobacteriales bacterium]